MFRMLWQSLIIKSDAFIVIIFPKQYTKTVGYSYHSVVVFTFYVSPKWSQSFILIREVFFKIVSFILQTHINNVAGFALVSKSQNFSTHIISWHFFITQPEDVWLVGLVLKLFNWMLPFYQNMLSINHKQQNRKNIIRKFWS